MVVLTHCAFNTGRINDGWTGAALSRMDFGVTLFFVVSGFLLARPFLAARFENRPRPATGHYLWKRALRILPLYWLVVVIALVVDPANNDAGLDTWLTHLTLTQIYPDALLASSVTQMWSLSTEVAFYLLLPLLISLLWGRGPDTRRMLVLLAGLGVVGLGWSAFAPSVIGGHAGQWLPGFLPWFGIGLAFAVCYCDPAAKARLDDIAADMTGWWIVGAGLFAVACSDLGGPRLLLTPTPWEGLTKSLLYGAAAACLLLPLIFGDPLGNPVKRVLAGPVPTALGEISYGIFCIHMLVLIQGMRLLGIDDFTGRFELVTTLTLTVSIVLAGLSYRFVEKPFLNLKDVGRLARRDPATNDPATTQSDTSAAP